MGLRYRKSIKLGGGFRINISKSGVGYSWGVPGYRITKTASGKTRHTYSIPGTGIGYVTENSSGRTSSRSTAPSKIQADPNYGIIHNIESSDISSFQPAEYKDLIRKISITLKLDGLLAYLTLCIFLAFNPVFLIIGSIAALLRFCVLIKGKVILEYNLDEEKEMEYKKRLDAWKSLNKCKKLWQINQTAKIGNKKTSAGADNALNRLPFTVKTKQPWFLKSNIELIVLPFKNETMIILPDKLLLIKGSRVGAIQYENIKYDIYATGFIEDRKVPKDAELVKYTWKYVNKDGTPDKRHKDNCQFPIYKYGRIDLSSEEGLNASIMCSNAHIAEAFQSNIF